MHGQDGKGKIVVSAPGGCLAALVRMVWVALVAVVLLIVAAAAVVRSDAGREWVCGRLSAWAGQGVAVDGIRFGWPCDLVLERLETAGVDDGAAGFRARSVRIGPRPSGGWRLRVDRATVNLRQGEDGAWQPECFAGLGEVPRSGCGGLSRLTRPYWRVGTLRMTDSVVRWRRANGETTALAIGVRFVMHPVRVLERTLCLLRLNADTLVMPDGSQATAVSKEWLATDGADFIELEEPSAAPVPVRAGLGRP